MSFLVGDFCQTRCMQLLALTKFGRKQKKKTYFIPQKSKIEEINMKATFRKWKTKDLIRKQWGFKIQKKLLGFWGEMVDNFRKKYEFRPTKTQKLKLIGNH